MLPAFSKALELGEKPTGQHCDGMEGVIEGGKDALEKDEEGACFDIGLIGAALRTEPYEIAGYEACISSATTRSQAAERVHMPGKISNLLAI
jgi:ferritin-like metal-binding protein YciE